jgi:LCP family protein required for cell wall assembly
MDVGKPADFPMVGRTLTTYPSRQYSPPVGPKPSVKPIKKKHRLSRAVKYTALLILIVLLIGGGWIGFKFYKNFGGFKGLWGIIHSTTLKGQDSGRVNILLAGNSADDPGHQGADLTDSIMIISIDTKNNTAFMLSVPRDLYVSLPTGAYPDNTGHGKINQAILDSSFSQAGYPSGGMGDLEYIVSQDLGIPIDYYALIDYTAFKDAVNAVGGVTVNINSPDGKLYDPSRDAYGNPLVDLSNGVHTLDGQQALDFARARGDSPYSIGFETSDFQRTADQRMLLASLEKKALSIGILSNPVKLGELFDSIGKNVKTDLTVGDMHTLYNLTKSSSSHIQSLTLSYGGTNPLLTNYTTPTGESALIPAAGLDNFSAIQSYMSQITAVGK